MELSIKLGSSGAAVKATGRVSRAKRVRHLSKLDDKAATMAPKLMAGTDRRLGVQTGERAISHGSEPMELIELS